MLLARASYKQFNSRFPKELQFCSFRGCQGPSQQIPIPLHIFASQLITKSPQSSRIPSYFIVLQHCRHQRHPCQLCSAYSDWPTASTSVLSIIAFAASTFSPQRVRSSIIGFSEDAERITPVLTTTVWQPRLQRVSCLAAR
jgi:hypothetical protein